MSQQIIKLETNFTVKELMCPCGCGQFIVQDHFFRRLAAARIIADTEFKITSWCRCASHNAHVGGSERSYHLTGEAADIYYTHPFQCRLIVEALESAQMSIIRIYEKHVHAAHPKISGLPMLSIGRYAKNV